MVNSISKRINIYKSIIVVLFVFFFFKSIVIDSFLISMEDSCFVDCELVDPIIIKLANTEYIIYFVINVILIISLIIAFIGLNMLEKGKSKQSKTLFNTSSIILIIYSVTYLISVIILINLGLNYPSFIDFIISGLFLFLGIIFLIIINRKKFIFLDNV